MSSTIMPVFTALAAEGFDPLAFDPSATLLTVVTFLGLLFVLWKFAWGPILSAIESREERIDSAIRTAEEERAAAKHMLEDYTARVANVEAEVGALREKGRGEAEAMRKEILAKARQEAEAVAVKAKNDIELARTQALEDLRNESVSLGLAIAGKVVGRAVDSDDHRRLADQVVSNLSSVGGNGA